MIEFRHYMMEKSSRDKMATKYTGKSIDHLEKMLKARNYSPADKKEIQKEIDNRNAPEKARIPKFRGWGKNVNEEAPSVNTGSAPGAGSDASLHTKKARLFKRIYRRHHTTKEDVKLASKR